jgi:hypothetical protein
MNPNDLLAQQQAMINQAMQNTQQMAIGVAALYLALLILLCWVIYMFYARLRGIEQEIMKFRIAYEFAHTPETRSRMRQETRATSTWPEPPKPLVPAPSSPEEQKYIPK